jgi:hypothetical protein
MGFLRVTMRRGGARRALAPLGSCLLLFAAGCTAGSSAAGSPASGASASAGGTGTTAGTTWIIDGQALAELGEDGMSSTQLSELFDNSHTYIVGGSGKSTETANIGNWTSRRSTTVTDLRAADFTDATAAVLYDDEDWSLTPKAQQEDPAKYEAEGYRLSREHGVVFIAAPAMDLVRVLDPDGSGSAVQRFLSLDLIGQAARDADVVDIQAQGLEGGAQYATFVTAAAQQARSANPDVRVLAGLSTNPSGRAISSTVLAEDADAVRGVVDGYWLNIPSSGTACPRCGTARPQPAVAWLEQLLAA